MMIWRGKSIWILVVFLGVFALGSTAQISDDFSDGDFTNNPIWSGADALFAVEEATLRSNSSDAANYYLSTPNTLMNGSQWDFWINLDFSTSGANFVDVYLVSDNADLTQTQNGYFLRFGGTPDELSFYKMLGGSETLLIDGEDGLIGSSSNNVFAIHVTRIGAGNWEIQYDEDATGSFVSGGSITDNDVISTTSFGFLIEQSTAASPVNSHYFDDIEVGLIPVDETPPSLVSATALSDTEVVVVFSEPVEITSAENTSNYNIDLGIANPAMATLDAENATTVNLVFANALTNGTTYELTAGGIADLIGNIMTSDMESFLYFVPDPGAFKEVVFNEIFPDPTPSVGLPEVEYIELFNAGDNFIDLENWVLVNTTTEKILTQKAMSPGAHVILCDADDQTVLEPFGDVLGVVGFTALSNGGDSLTLRNAQNDIIDIVVYSDNWYNDPDKDDGGYSLELINPFSDCGGANNWSASNGTNGGTPGIENSIFSDAPDETAPEIESHGVVSAQSVEIFFNEIMDEISLISGSYLWNEGLTTTEAIPSADLLSVLLLLDGPIESGIAYQISVSDVSDCVGNVIEANSTSDIFLGEQPFQGELLFSEIMADPSPSNGLPEAEFFEIYNAGNRALELQGCFLNDKEFIRPYVLLPDEYLICIDDEAEIDFLLYPDKYIVDELGLTYLTNGGRSLTLYNSNGEFLDRADYDLSWYRDSDKEDGGYSLERINMTEPCRGGENWIGANADAGGTPNAQNSVFDDTPDELGPEVVQVFVRNETQLEVVFSETLDTLGIPSAIVDISPNLEISNAEYKAPFVQSVFVNLASPMEAGIAYELALSGVFDCSGNEMIPVKGLVFGLPEPAELGDLLINEILFNPFTGGVDFVEIYNVSNKVISLQDWMLQNQDLTSRVITENPISILPNAFMVFTSDAQSTNRDYPLGRPENYLEMESLPSFNNSEGAVLLVDPKEETMDRFDYLEEYHLELLVSFKGVSLEKVSYTMATNVADNWTSAAENVGFATPGYLNSQYNPEGKSTSTVSLKEEIFSPDNDGFQDLLFINYDLDGTGFIANITIYDARGSEIKQLTNNLVLGTSGTITWDGVANNGTKARIGPHIVYVDLFDQDGRTEKFKIPCIVAGKLSD